MKMSKKVSIIVIVAVMILVAAFFVAFYWRGSTKPIEAVANKFQPPSSWVLKSEHVDPPSLLCLDGSCPGLQRTWSLNHFVDFEALDSSVRVLGWKLQSNTCPTTNDEPLKNGVCMIYASYHGYLIQLSVDSHNGSENTAVTMNVAKDNAS